jgi:hypothetical protein
MPQQDDHRKAVEVKLARRGNMAAADKARLLALPERWLRPADQLDYMIRRRVIPVTLRLIGQSHRTRFSDGP